MNCEHCQELLPLRERGDLSPDVQAKLAAHLGNCAHCARAAKALLELNALLDVDVQPTPGLRSRVLARLEQETAQSAAPALSFATLFARLWPSRPLGAFSYSFVLVLCGMFGGQLLPSDQAELAAESLYQLCPVPDGPNRSIL